MLFSNKTQLVELIHGLEGLIVSRPAFCMQAVFLLAFFYIFNTLLM